ncbi:MAG TPA: 2-dehydropantoate 2-reductase [Marinobacter sp.]|jgi:2-dehydropantoate 2-reductase|nr:2-dehydropantoate 2-reductase [Marinobacter sp.]
MIAILGAGSLGRLWAATLPAGQVAFVPRPGQMPEPVRYQFHPTEGEAFCLSIPWLQSGEAPELLLVTTKAGDTLEALKSALPSMATSTPVALFQNGLGSQHQVAEAWPDRPVLAASTTEGANRPGPRTLVHAGTGQTWIGPLTDSAHLSVPSVVNRLASGGLKVLPETDIMPRLWQKLVINAGINPFTALLNCRNGELPDQPFYRSHIDDVCQEATRIGAALGLETRTGPQLREQVEGVIKTTAGNVSSMLADARQGRPTEIRYINGWLADNGARLGIPTPVNQLLTERVESLLHRNH